MRKLTVILSLFLFSMSMFLPATASARSVNAVDKPQIRVQIGQRRYRGGNRGRHLGWYNGRRAYYYNYNPSDRRYVRRYYNNNGRRVVRWYWNY